MRYFVELNIYCLGMLFEEVMLRTASCATTSMPPGRYARLPFSRFIPSARLKVSKGVSAHIPCNIPEPHEGRHAIRVVQHSLVMALPKQSHTVSTQLLQHLVFSFQAASAGLGAPEWCKIAGKVVRALACCGRNTWFDRGLQNICANH